jgi:hypothetical protein
VLVQYGEELSLDFMVDHDEEILRLASGGTISGRSLLAPPQSGIRHARTYRGGPGLGLWEAVKSSIFAEISDDVRKHPGQRLTADQIATIVDQLVYSKYPLEMYGRSLPVSPGAPLVRIDRSLCSLYDYNLVTEVVTPRGMASGTRYMQVIMKAPDPIVANAPPPTAGPPAHAPSRKSKGTAPNTLHAIRAMAAVFHSEGSNTDKALTFAKRAAEKAQELDLPGANSLNPDGSTMREIAAAFLEGVGAADRETR